MCLKLSKSLFFFLFIFTPLAFGTTEPWSYAIMETGTALACLLFFISILKNKETLYQVPGITPLLFFLFYILFQFIPLPSFIVEWLSPDAFKIHQATNLMTDTTSWMTISVNQKATLSEFFRYSTYVMFYVLTVQLLRKKEMLKITILVIAFFGGLLAFSSILQFYLTEDMALWFRYCPINAMVMGPYVNHNHYAGLMELIFPVVLGLFLFYRPRIGNTSLIKGIAEIFSQEKANIHILIGTSALLILISIFVSLSRGAMVSTCLSLFIFIFFLMKQKISKGSTALMISVIILTAISIGWFGWDQIFERFANLKNAHGVIYESRLDFWNDTKNIIAHYKITGSGMGTFPHIYPLFRFFKSGLFLAHAHNDYLELLAEGGIIGFSIAASFLFVLFYKTYKVFTKRRDAFSIYLYMGSITALAAILFHSFTDFNMHIGANGLWFFFVAGIAVSAANTGLRKQSKATRLLPVSSGTKKVSAALMVTGITIFAILFNVSNLLGIFYYSNIKNYTMNADTPPDIIKKIEKIAGFAAQFDPFMADYPFTKANTAWFLNDLENSKKNFATSIRLDPLNSLHLNRFGAFLSRQNEIEKAGFAIKKSMLYDQSNAEYSFQYALWLLAKKEYKEGLKYLKKTLMLNEKYFERVLTLMIVSGISDSDIEQTIPDDPGLSIQYAQYLSSIGLTGDATVKFMNTLDLIEAMSHQTVFNQKLHIDKVRYLYYDIYWFFYHRKDYKNALEVMLKAEATQPTHAGIKVTLADLYYQQGILYKALEKYDQALLLEPGNKRALSMIKKINP